MTNLYDFISSAAFLQGEHLHLIHYLIEGLIFVSIILHFFHKYQDADTLEIVSSYKSIAFKYIFRGWFLIDLISIVPYEFFFSDGFLIKLMRLIRLPKLSELVNTARFDKLIDSFFSNSKGDRLMIIYHLRYTFRIIRLVIIATFITYGVACIWYLFCDKMSDNYSISFISKYHLREKDDFDKLVISCYFVLTTLSTVGYGDLIATNNAERIFCIFLMLLGVAVFSYVMGNFTDLITSYDKKLGISDKGEELQNWLTLISKFSNTGSKPLSNELIKKIDNHFAYYWEHDRNSTINKNDPYLSFLPKSLKLKIIEFLWGDVLNKFSNFFMYYSGNKEKFYKFYYDISFSLMPRKFSPKENIFIPDEDIEEMYLIFEGSVEIGFSLKSFNIDDIRYCKIIKSVESIGEFYCLFNKKSKYFYKCTNEIKAWGINKYDLLSALEKHEDLFTKYKTKAYRKYHDYIKIQMEKSEQDFKILTMRGRNDNRGKFKQGVHGVQHEQGEHQDNINNYFPGEQGLQSKFIFKRLNKKNSDIDDILNEIEKKFVKIDDDYSNLSRYIFNSNLECEKDLLRMNKELDEMQSKLDKVLENTEVEVLKI